jgi:uncharacterized ion transporter superfamily protein YfcC
MKIFKNIAEWLAITMMFLLSLGVHASSYKSSPQKYEVKSEILNFKYEEMAYPMKCVDVGVKSESKVPGVRKPGKQLSDEDKGGSVKDTASVVIFFIIIILGAIAVFVFVPLIIQGILEVIRRDKEFK